MDMNEQIKQAARRSITDEPNLAYDGQYSFPESERVRIHFKEHDNKRFSVDILVGGHPSFPSETSVDVLTEQIKQELMKHKQRN